MKKAYIMRGLPGSGKSTLARRLAGESGRVHSTDDFFKREGEYHFDPALLQKNHHLNFESFSRSLIEGVSVVVLDNTNSQKWEYEKHVATAMQYGYEVEIISMPHLPAETAASKTLHHVPIDTIIVMLARWEPDLRETYSIGLSGQGTKMLKIINVTKHSLNFRAEDGAEFEIAPSGVVIDSTAHDEPAGVHPSGAELVRVRFIANAASAEALDQLERENPGAIIVGSMFAAQGFPGRVVAMIATPGYERRPPAEKRMRPDKFTTF